MTLARTIGGLVELDREILDADRAELETADGKSRRVNIEQLRAAILTRASDAGLEILEADRDTQRALLGAGGSLPPLSPGGIPYGGPAGNVVQVASTEDGRALLASSLAEQRARLGIGTDPFGVFGRRFRALPIAPVGLFYSSADLDAWRDRVSTGPFVVAGDAGSGFPGEWTRIVNSTNAFMVNPMASRQATRPEVWDPVYTAHIDVLSAAFHNLLIPSAAVGEAVKTELWWQLSTAGFRYLPTDDFGPSDSGTNHWGMPSWYSRLLMAYDFSKHLFLSSEREYIEQWFNDAAWMLANNIHRDLVVNFPNRLSRDYSVRANKAADDLGMRIGQPGEVSPEGYTHRDAQGRPVNRINTLGLFYNNRRATGIEFVGLAGVLTNDAGLIDHAKLYIEEWLKFAVFPDGMTSEYNRTGDYGSASNGLWYNGVNTQAAFVVADALARRGDFSLYDFATADGIGQTRGWKSLRTPLMAQSHIAAGAVLRYCGDITCPNTTSFTHTNNRISPLAPTGVYPSQYGIHDTWSAMIANGWYQDADIEASYMRRAAGSIPINPAILAPAGPIPNPWGGSGHIFPSIPFMFGMLEGARAYPARAGSPEQIIVDADGVVFTNAEGEVFVALAA